MAVSPCTALCSADARPSSRHASPWGVRRATGAQRRSSAGTLVRVLALPVKAGLSQGRQARRATASYHAIGGARYSVPHRVSTLYVQASPMHVSESIASANIGPSVIFAATNRYMFRCFSLPISLSQLTSQSSVPGRERVGGGLEAEHARDGRAPRRGGASRTAWRDVIGR